MIKRKTVFEQVPLAIARKVAAKELKQKVLERKNAGSKQKASGRLIATGLVASEGASL